MLLLDIGLVVAITLRVRKFIRKPVKFGIGELCLGE